MMIGWAITDLNGYDDAEFVYRPGLLIMPDFPAVIQTVEERWRDFNSFTLWSIRPERRRRRSIRNARSDPAANYNRLPGWPPGSMARRRDLYFARLTGQRPVALEDYAGAAAAYDNASLYPPSRAERLA
jgi:hypothetical protein